MKPFNVKIVSRIEADICCGESINRRVQDLATKGVKIRGWDQTNLRIRAIRGQCVEISLNASLTPTPIKKGTCNES